MQRIPASAVDVGISAVFGEGLIYDSGILRSGERFLDIEFAKHSKYLGGKTTKVSNFTKINRTASAKLIGASRARIMPNERLEVPSKEETTRALERVLSRGIPFLYRNAYRLLSNTADAEDAVQDALLSAYIHLDQFKGRAQISTWLSSIVLNCARMQLRRRSRHAEVSIDAPIGEMFPLGVCERLRDDRPSPEDEHRASELSASLTRFYRRLSPTLRRTLQLRNIDGLSIRETAEILGIPRGTVKAQSSRARKKLKEWMAGAHRPQSERSSKNMNAMRHSSALRVSCEERG